jgi:hypothetical protein
MTRSLHRPYPRAVTESDSRALGERNFSRRPKDNLIKKLKVTAPETGAPVYGGDVIFMDFKT